MEDEENEDEVEQEKCQQSKETQICSGVGRGWQGMGRRDVKMKGFDGRRGIRSGESSRLHSLVEVVGQMKM